MKLLIGYLRKEKLRELRTKGSGSLRGVRDVLYDGSELAGEIFVEMVDQCFFIREIWPRTSYA
jgi:hypothetical protein